MSTQASGFYRLVEGRASTREFAAQPVPPEVLERILQAACRAPSAHNLQPWRFVLLDQGAARQSLAGILQRRLEDDLRADGLDTEAVGSRVSQRQRRILNPPILVVLCLTMEDMDSYPDERRRSAERCMGEQSVALAGGTLLLAAQAEGLGACWLCAPLFATEAVRQALDLPQAWEPRAFVALGYPAQSPQPGERRPLAEVLAWR
jgi:coenzyme F420-0:L-glutamate ligase / coenzyme F420-1:gamma-L-glutamate ligase